MSHLLHDRGYLDGYRRSSHWSNIKQNRTNNPFFVKPYIHFGELRHEPVNNITLTSFGRDPMTFSGNVWVIGVLNKKHMRLSRNAVNSSVDITIFRNGADNKNSVRLPWRGGSIPTKCNYPSSFQTRDEYRAKLPFCYIGALSHEQFNPTILVGGTHEIMVACTFSELDSLYIISQKTMGEDDVISIEFNVLDKYEFLMKYYNGLITHEKKFRLSATSWNDVELTWV